MLAIAEWREGTFMHAPDNFGGLILALERILNEQASESFESRLAFLRRTGAP